MPHVIHFFFQITLSTDTT